MASGNYIAQGIGAFLLGALGGAAQAKRQRASQQQDFASKILMEMVKSGGLTADTPGAKDMAKAAGMDIGPLVALSQQMGGATPVGQVTIPGTGMPARPVGLINPPTGEENALLNQLTVAETNPAEAARWSFRPAPMEPAVPLETLTGQPVRRTSSAQERYAKARLLVTQAVGKGVPLGEAINAVSVEGQFGPQEIEAIKQEFMPTESSRTLDESIAIASAIKPYLPPGVTIDLQESGKYLVKVNGESKTELSLEQLAAAARQMGLPVSSMSGKTEEGMTVSFARPPAGPAPEKPEKLSPVATGLQFSQQFLSAYPSATFPELQTALIASVPGISPIDLNQIRDAVIGDRASRIMLDNPPMLAPQARALAEQQMGPARPFEQLSGEQAPKPLALAASLITQNGITNWKDAEPAIRSGGILLTPDEQNAIRTDLISRRVQNLMAEGKSQPVALAQAEQENGPVKPLEIPEETKLVIPRGMQEFASVEFRESAETLLRDPVRREDFLVRYGQGEDARKQEELSREVGKVIALERAKAIPSAEEAKRKFDIGLPALSAELEGLLGIKWDSTKRMWVAPNGEDAIAWMSRGNLGGIANKVNVQDGPRYAVIAAYAPALTGFPGRLMALDPVKLADVRRQDDIVKASAAAVYRMSGGESGAKLSDYDALRAEALLPRSTNERSGAIARAIHLMKVLQAAESGQAGAVTAALNAAQTAGIAMPTPREATAELKRRKEAADASQAAEQAASQALE